MALNIDLEKINTVGMTSHRLAPTYKQLSQVMVIKEILNIGKLKNTHIHSSNLFLHKTIQK